MVADVWRRKGSFEHGAQVSLRRSFVNSAITRADQPREMRTREERKRKTRVRVLGLAAFVEEPFGLATVFAGGEPRLARRNASFRSAGVVKPLRLATSGSARLLLERSCLAVSTLTAQPRSTSG